MKYADRKTPLSQSRISGDRRYDGWNTEHLQRVWTCKSCGHVQYSGTQAHYHGLIDGPYCAVCRYRKEEESTNG